MAVAINENKLKLKIKKKGDRVVGMILNGVDISRHVAAFSFGETYGSGATKDKLDLSLVHCDIETIEVKDGN